MTWAPDYITVDELKAYLRLFDTVDDDELALDVTAASRAIDRVCRRQFGSATEERTYDAVYDRHLGAWVVTIDDLQTQTGLAVEIDGAAYTGWKLVPRNAVARGKAWTEMILSGASLTGSPEVAITAMWGWTAVPDPVAAAARLQASRFVARRDSPYGIAGSPQDGSEVRLLASVDPDVRVMLRDYRRPWAAA